MSPDEVERQLARLRRLAAAAAERLAEIDRDVDRLREFIDEIEALVARGEEKAENRTLRPEGAQVEVVTK